MISDDSRLKNSRDYLSQKSFLLIENEKERFVAVGGWETRTLLSLHSISLIRATLYLRSINPLISNKQDSDNIFGFPRLATRVPLWHITKYTLTMRRYSSNSTELIDVNDRTSMSGWLFFRLLFKCRIMTSLANLYFEACFSLEAAQAMSSLFSNENVKHEHPFTSGRESLTVKKDNVKTAFCIQQLLEKSFNVPHCLKQLKAI
jgi:hypothetical protein